MLKETKKHFIPWTLLITSILLGLLVVAQFRLDKFSIDDDLVGQIADAEATAQLLELEQDALKEELSTLRDEIESLTTVNLSQEDKEKLESLKSSLALTEISGEGILITMQDSQNLPEEAISYERLLVHAADLRDITQKLWAAGAEGISINDERLVAMSPITCVGNSVLVNDTRMVPPFEIKVIGDPSILLQSLNFEMYFPELADRIKSGDISFSITPTQNLTLPAYDGEMNTKYIKTND